MFFFRIALIAAIMVVFGSAASAQISKLANGNDTFHFGAVFSEALNAPGDAFLSARTVDAGGLSRGDLHIVGYDVAVSTETLQDLYAIGASVVIRSNIGHDLTAAGFSVRTEQSSETKGNARLLGNSVTIGGPVAGALLATGQNVILNAPIQGDVRIAAHSITFGPMAEVSGTLTYSATETITVPERVAPPDRVVFVKLSESDRWDEWEFLQDAMPAFPSFASMLFGFVISLLFFVVLGALALGFMPKRVAKMRKSIGNAPGQSILLGVVGLSILIGLVPITGLTIIGLPFVPFAILGIVIVWTLGYALGAYSVAMRLWIAFGGSDEPGNAVRLLVFAASITFIAALNFIPFVGWIANYTLVLLGIGAMTRAVFEYFIGNPGQALDVDLKPIED